MAYPLNFWQIFATILERLSSCDEERTALRLSVTPRHTLLPFGN